MRLVKAGMDEVIPPSPPATDCPDGSTIAAARVVSKAGHLRAVDFDGRAHLLPATCTAVQE